MDNLIKTTAELFEADAVPALAEVHIDPNSKCASKNALRKSITDKPLAQKSPAQWAYERVILYLKNFEEQLDNEHEMAMGFAGGNTGILRIEGMGYFDPDIVTFYGTEADGSKTQLVQNVNQLNVMLRAMPKLNAQVEPNRIGFKLAAQLEKSVAQVKKQSKKKPKKKG
jgi:hypothetical protein